MTFHRGDVVLVPFPFSDLSTTKVRPAVVVSSTLYHSTEPDILKSYPSLPTPRYSALAASSTRASRCSRSRGTYSGVACERSRPQP